VRQVEGEEVRRTLDAADHHRRFAEITATFALNAGLWFRRGRFAMVFSSLAASCRRCAENHLSQLFRFPEPPLSRPDETSVAGHNPSKSSISVPSHRTPLVSKCLSVTSKSRVVADG
jgi:hypothetical protein